MSHDDEHGFAKKGKTIPIDCISGPFQKQYITLWYSLRHPMDDIAMLRSSGEELWCLRIEEG